MSLLEGWTGRNQAVKGALALIDILDSAGTEGLYSDEVNRRLSEAGANPVYKQEYARWARARNIAVVATRGPAAIWRILPVESDAYRKWLKVTSEAHYSETIHALRASTGVPQARPQYAAWKGSAVTLGTVLGKSLTLIESEMKPLVLGDEIRDIFVAAGYIAA
jgi:hypothetical protein